MIHQLRFQLIALMIAIVLIMTAVMIALTWFATQNAFVQFVTITTDNQNARVEQSVGRFIEEVEDIQQIQPLVDELSYSTGVDIIVVDGISGEMLLESDGENEEVVWIDHDFVFEPNQLFQLPITPIAETTNFTVRTQPMIASSQIPLSPSQNFSQSVSQSLLISATVASSIAVMIAIAMSHTITKPIRILTEATKQLENGDQTPKIPVSGRGEIADLSRAFNNMVDTLQRNEQIRRNMVTDVAHELRTPMTNIRGYIEAMQDGIIPLEKSQLDSLHEEALHITHLITDLQQLSLAEAGKLSLDFAPVNLPDVIQQVLTLWSPAAKEHNIELEAQIEPNLPQIMADHHRLIQILQNLLSNAIRYSPPNSTVTIKAHYTDQVVSISVTDRGAGIEANELPFVFDRFYRADESRNRTTGGTGLGLAITRELVHAHGGEIEAKSIPNHATTFTIKFFR